MRILQQDQDLHIATWSAAQAASGEKKSSVYRGLTRTADGQVSGYAEVCRPSAPYKELVRILPAMEQDGDLTFTADTIFVSDSLPKAPGQLIVETCTWVMKRTDAAPPEIEVCDAE